MEAQEEKKSSKKWWILGGVFLVLLLAAGAFMGGMWMVGQSSGVSEVMNPETFTADLVRRDETPSEPPEMVGGVRSVEDNSIFVTTVNSTGAFGHGPGASMSEGPTVEVVVGRDTAILADVTALDFDFGDPEGGMIAMMQSEGLGEMVNAERSIEPGALEDIEPGSMIWIWGDRSGDRINATAVVYLVLPFSMGDMMPSQ